MQYPRCKRVKGLIHGTTNLLYETFCFIFLALIHATASNIFLIINAQHFPTKMETSIANEAVFALCFFFIICAALQQLSVLQAKCTLISKTWFCGEKPGFAI